LQHSNFKQILENCWNIPVGHSDPAKRITAKLKNLRKSIKLWAKNLPCLRSLIDKVNSLITLLDNLEEFRTLSLEEWNLRDILKNHVTTLLQNQKSYWKQRGKIKQVKLGDANTRFFHNKATISYRHNYISVLVNENLAEIIDHDGKADILWKAFKQRMRKTDRPNMQFNLQDIYGEGMDSETSVQLEVPFIDKEIDDIIKDLTNDKSPGPDGFNNEFFKN
jgi:regulator of replication initiation timing